MDLDLALGPIQSGVTRQTAPEAVATALREAILSGALPGGSRLIQATLAAYFGVSSTPVREALRQLAAEGLVRFDSYRGAVVISSTLEDVREVWELLLQLEPLAIRKAVARVTDEELENLERLNEEMMSESDLSRWLRLNREFHEALQEAAHSPFLVATLASLIEVAGFHTAIAIRTLEPEHVLSNAEHAEIIAAIEARDPDVAAEAITRQLRRSLEVLEAQIAAAEQQHS